jgi:DNA helicase-2/ATP-dependent DNA helicase PcrA
LEFRAVFITGLEEGLFPHENSANEPNGLEEERRLMYVAITRARERLMMSWASSRQMHGRSQYHLVSRFLDEIPSDYLIKQKGAGVLGREFSGFSGSARPYQSSAWDDWVGERQQSQQRSEPLLTERDKAFVERVNESRVVRGGDHGEIEFGVGMRVQHAKFGRGTVRALEGTWDNAKAQIDFDRYGRKWLSLAVAKLELCQ